MSTISFDFTGRVFAVSGASGALGASVVSSLSAARATVAQIDHSSAAAKSNATLYFGGVDLADEAAAARTLSAILAKTRRLDGLINIAGGFAFDKLAGGSLQTWDAMYQRNLRTAVALSMAALPHLAASGHGRIVNLGSAAASQAGAGMGAYAASKAGVARFTEALAAELKDQGVTVNAVLPSIMDTERNRLDMPKADFSRWVKTQEVADLIAFLLSDAAVSITGALIPITGRV